MHFRPAYAFLAYAAVFMTAIRFNWLFPYVPPAPGSGSPGALQAFVAGMILTSVLFGSVLFSAGAGAALLAFDVCQFAWTRLRSSK